MASLFDVAHRAVTGFLGVATLASAGCVVGRATQVSGARACVC